MTPIVLGSGGVNRQAKDLTVGVNGVNRKVKEVWAGVDGVNRKVYSSFSYRVETARAGIGAVSSIDGSGNWVSVLSQGASFGEALYCYLDIYFDTPLSFAAKEIIFQYTVYLTRSTLTSVGFGAKAWWDGYPNGTEIMYNTGTNGATTMDFLKSDVLNRTITNMTRLRIWFIKFINQSTPNVSAIIYNGGLTVKGNQIFFK